MKKFLTLALLCFISIVMYGATTGFINGVMYTINDDGTASVNSFNAYATDFTEEIVIPETLEYDGNYYTVTSIEKQGLQPISQVTRITVTTVSLPASLESIGNLALATCSTITTIYCYAENPPTLGSDGNSFNKLDGVTVYVPASSVEAYESQWGASPAGGANFTYVALDDEGGTPEPTEYVLSFYPENGGEMTIPEEGLKEVVVSCEDGISVGPVLNTYASWRVGGDEGSASVTKIVTADDGKSLTFSLSSAITTAGTYSLQYSSRGSWISDIPAGMFLLGPDEVESEEMTYSFTLLEASDTGGTEGGAVDVLNQDLIGISGTSYVDFTVTTDLGTTYTGNIANNNGTLQMRSSNSNSGIVSTVSKGYVRKVVANWNEDLMTTANRTLDVYGSNTPYSSASDLYSTSTRGTLLGQLSHDNGDTTLEVNGDDYAYIGLRSNTGAIYLDDITITYEEAEIDNPSTGGDGGSGTADDPYTVSEAIEVISALDADENIEGIYVKGIVSRVGDLSSTYNDLIYYISDDGTTSNQLEIYYGYYLNNEPFTSADQIKVGDKVVVTGTFTNYRGNTPEGAMGATWIYSLEEGEGGDEGGDGNITRTSTTLTITNPNVEEGTETVSVDISSLGYENAEDVTSITVDEYTTMTIAQGEGNNPPKYYTNDTSLRIYADNTITFSSTREIAKVVFNCVSSYTGNTTATVEFDGNEILFCNLWTSTSGGTQLRIQSVEITYTTADEEEDNSIYFVEPENGSSVTSLESFNIIWNDKGEYNENNNGVTWNYLSTGASWEADVYDDHENVVTTLFMESYIYPDGYTFMDGKEAIGLQFGYYNFITTPGTYTVTIPGGLIGFGETSHGSLGRYYEDIVVTYTVVSAGYSISPASGTDVTELTTVTITADDGEITLLDEDAEIVVTNREGTEITTATASIENGVLVITLVDEITNPQLAGEYHIAIPGGLFSCNDAENEETTLIYYVNPDVEYSLDPEDGEEVKSLTTITVGYHDGVCVASGVQLSSMQILNTAGDVVTSVASYDTLEETYNGGDYATIYAVVLNLADSITTEGTYTLNIPRNTLQFYVGMAGDGDDEGISGGGVTDGWIDNNPITATYTVSSDAIDPADYVLSFDPANGEEVESLDEIKILCDKGIYANVEDTFNVTDTNGTIVSVLSIGEAIYEVEGDESSLVVGYNCSFSPVVSDPGTYSVSFVRGEFLLGSDYSISSAQTTLSYTVAGEKEAGTTSTGTSDGFTYTVTPGEGEVESLSSIYIGCETGVFDEDMSTASDIKVYKDGDSEPITTALRVIADQGDDYDIGFTIVLSNKLIDEGDYKVVIPAGFFSWLVDGIENDVLCSEITLNYIISKSGDDSGDSGDSGNDDLYEKLCEEIAETNSYLDDTWSTIVSSYPDAANTLLDRYNDLAQEIAALQSTVDTQYEEGRLEEEVDADEAEIAAIREAIAQLLADAQSDTTGLYKIGMDYSNMNVYTLGGQKINAPTMRGVYIIDGKKVLVK